MAENFEKYWLVWIKTTYGGNFKFPTSYPRIQDGGRWRERTRDRDVGL